MGSHMEVNNVELESKQYYEKNFNLMRQKSIEVSIFFAI